jgi:hypothetical protein
VVGQGCGFPHQLLFEICKRKSTVCSSKGHAITSVVTKETQIPGTAIFVKQYEVLCSQCGSGIEEIKKERASRSGTSQRDRKAKAVPQQPTENQTEVHQ